MFSHYFFRETNSQQHVQYKLSFCSLKLPLNVYIFIITSDSITLQQCNHIQAAIDEKQQELNDLRERSDGLAEDLESAHRETKQKKRAKAKLDQILKNQRKELQKARGIFVNLEPQATQLRIEIDHSEKKIDGLQDQEASMARDVAKVQKQIKNLKSKMKAAEVERKNFEQEIIDARANVSLCIKSYHRSVADFIF